MNNDDKDATSELEGRLLDLLETEPRRWPPSEQVDWIHDPNIAFRIDAR